MTTVFIISAPSGSGKSTLVSRLVAAGPRGCAFPFPTRRESRAAGKSQGESYIYISRAEFEIGSRRGEFLEYAEVFGNYYGTNRKVLEQAEQEGKDVVLDIDVQGARQLKDRISERGQRYSCWRRRGIFLEQRLQARSEDSDETIQRRLRDAAEEIRNYKQYDYVLVNYRVDESVDALAVDCQS